MPAKESTALLLSDIDTIINDCLGVADFRTKTATLDLAARHTCDINGEKFIWALFDRLDEIWNTVSTQARRSSPENFRWHVPKLSIFDENTSLEVKLERALVGACIRANRKDWANQVPLISGVFGPRAYKKRAVDLVRQMNDGGFEFVELKVATGTPLSAAMQVVLYGLLWLLSRRDRHALGYDRPSLILDTSHLQLSVLAPSKFYSRFNLPDLPTALDVGLIALGIRHGVRMGFRQMMFPENFRWPAPYDDNELLRFLDGRKVT